MGINDDYNFHTFFTRHWRLPYEARRRISCKGKQVYKYERQCSFTDPTAEEDEEGGRNWHMDLYVYTTYHNTVKFMQHDDAYEYHKRDILSVKRCMFMGIETRCPINPKIIFKNFTSTLNQLTNALTKR